MTLALALLAALAPPEDPSRLARVELVADVTAIEPGASFWIGLRFELEPEWHVYWENPGESGLATRVEFQVPEGFEVGPLLYPAPERQVLPGDITCFVYDEEVVFLARVQAPPQIHEGTLPFAADASWLVCKEACYFQENAFELGLAKGRAARSDAAAAIERSRARLPRPWSEARATASWSGAPPSALSIAAEGASELDFLPLRVEGVEMSNGACSHDARGARIELGLRAEDPEALRAQGVLAVRRDGAWSYFHVDSRPPARDGG